MTFRFAIGDWVRNRKTKEDAKVTALYFFGLQPMYQVSVSRDTSRMRTEMGTEDAHWAEDEVDSSPDAARVASKL